MGYDPRPFIGRVHWVFAKTMAHYNPHEYVVESLEGGPQFDSFVALINQGRVRRYKGYPYRHITVERYDYWLTCADNCGTIINRKPTAAAGWDPE